MARESFTDMPERMAEDIVEQVDGINKEDHINYHISKDLVDIKFLSDNFDNHEEFLEATNKVKNIIIKDYRKGNKCPHSASDDCVETVTYQQSSGLSIKGFGASLSGGEIVQVCATCGVVIKVVKEASMTGE